MAPPCRLPQDAPEWPRWGQIPPSRWGQLHLTQPTARARSTNDLLESVTWPAGHQQNCPRCTEPTTGLQEQAARVRGVRDPVVIATAVPCGCHVDEYAAALQAAVPSN